MDFTEKTYYVLEKVGALKVLSVKYDPEAPLPYAKATCLIINEEAFHRIRDYLKGTIKKEPIQGGELNIKRNKENVVFDLMLTSPANVTAFEELVNRVSCFNAIESFLCNDRRYQNGGINQMGILTPKQINYLEATIRRAFYPLIDDIVKKNIKYVNKINTSAKNMPEEYDPILSRLLKALKPIKEEISQVQTIFGFELDNTILDLKYISKVTHIPLDYITKFIERWEIGLVD